jgi:hypothetical protein
MHKANAALLAGLLLVTACSHGEDSSSASTHDPCGLLTKADLEAVTHKPVADVTKVDDTHCAYGPKGGGMETITVEAAWTGADTQFQGGALASSLMHDSEKAPKVGDASYAIAMGNVFYARKGDAYVGIDMRASTVPVNTVGPELARRALARM